MVALVEENERLLYRLKTENHHLSKKHYPELSESLGLKLDVSQRYLLVKLLRNTNPPKRY